jgi:hypothetical protein
MCMVCGCSSNNVKTKQQIAEHSENNILNLPERLIADYSAMKQNDTVSWIWTKPGFSMDNCRFVKTSPLKNFTGLSHAAAVAEISNVLTNIFSLQAAEHGNINVGVEAAIVEMKFDRGFFERFSSLIDSYPFIVIELVIFEEKSKTVLFKLCHYTKGDAFVDVLQEMTDDLKTFFAKKLSS